MQIPGILNDFHIDASGSAVNRFIAVCSSDSIRIELKANLQDLGAAATNAGALISYRKLSKSQIKGYPNKSKVSE